MGYWVAIGAGLLAWKAYDKFGRPPAGLRRNEAVTSLVKGKKYKVQFFVDPAQSVNPNNPQGLNLIGAQLAADGWSILAPIQPLMGANSYQFTGLWNPLTVPSNTITTIPSGNLTLTYGAFYNLEDQRGVAKPSPNLLKNNYYKYTIRMDGTSTPSLDTVANAVGNNGFTHVTVVGDGVDPFLFSVRGLWAGSLVPVPVLGPFPGYSVITASLSGLELEDPNVVQNTDFVDTAKKVPA